MTTIAPRPILLAGPPGCGKSTLGAAASEALSLRFQDSPFRGSMAVRAERDQFHNAIAEGSADVIALSWALAQESAVRKLAGMSGTLILLWAYPLATETILDAMARFLIHLRDRGVSPRTLSGIAHDLNAAGLLIMMYEPPRRRQRRNVLESFSMPPYEFEFSLKFSDAPTATNRYRRSLERFAQFLADSELIGVESRSPAYARRDP